MEIAVAGGWLRRHVIAFTLALAGPAASAMGGHFDVDDADVLAPGRCQVELWAVRGEVARIAHIGPACRVGPLEIGVHFERLSGEERSDRVVGVQLKAAAHWLADVQVGVVAAASRATTEDVSLLTLFAPVTWSLGADVRLNGSLGVDHLSTRGSTVRAGIGGEWAFHEHVTLLAERLRAFDETLTRLGIRIVLGEQTSIDFSGARISGSGNRVWGLGLNVEFGR